ncbi:40S ribosomal protein S11 [Chytridium lagenaria]|nr:40S ribosomal protein S11 [Chytridium lagenaria]
MEGVDSHDVRRGSEGTEWMMEEVVTEKAFQRQAGIFLNSKLAAKKKGGPQRWYNDVGLGFKTPREAIEGTYIDKKCPFTSGTISIRGRILTGVVVSTKMKRTLIIRRDYLHYIPKYNRYEKRHKNLAAHVSPAFIGVEAGDVVTVGQCRPISKTVRFNVLKVQKKTVKGAGGKQFAKF